MFWQAPAKAGACSFLSRLLLKQPVQIITQF